MGILERVSEDRKEAAKRVDILALAERYTQLRRKTTDGEYEGPCPKCGGTKRFTVHEREHWWFCRDCHPKWSDTIEFVRWMQPGLTFVEAVEQLTGESVPAPATKRKPAPAPQKAQQSTDWRSKAEKIVKAAQDRLWTAEGEPASAYLLRRGLEPHTWLQYGLGYCLSVALPNTKGQQRSPAISIPWYAGGKLVALRYRFLEVQNYIDVDGKERSEKVTAEHGSQFAGRLYGGHALPDWMLAPAPEEYSHPVEKLCTLLIVEGEINCMSCWQVASETNLHVLSLGSEGQQIPPAAMPFIRRYGQVLVWADREQIAKGLWALCRVQ